MGLSIQVFIDHASVERKKEMLKALLDNMHHDHINQVLREMNETELIDLVILILAQRRDLI